MNDNMLSGLYLTFIHFDTLQLVVFNIKSQEARIVHLTPNDKWGGAGLLGVTIRLDNYAGAEDRFIRVLSVVENGPAAVSGLMNDGTDFILGTTHHTVNSLSHFAQLLQENIDRIIELYVYNSNTDIVRVVTLMPSYEWNSKNGDSGLLGAEVGTGYLHRLPYRSRSTSGKCVERKVRYVPAAPEANNNVVLLEDAPQMEMELPEADTDDDDENAEEIYVEPKRERNDVPQAPEQVNGSGTAEDVSFTSSSIGQGSVQNTKEKSDSNVMSLSNASMVHHPGQTPQQAQLPPQILSNTTAAAAAIFGQPLVPPPPPPPRQQQQLHQKQPTALPPVTTALGPPPPTYYGASSFAPPVVSYALPSTTQPQQQSFYYGGSQQHAKSMDASFSYAPPTTSAMMPPPPLVGGVWNHATSSNK